MEKKHRIAQIYGYLVCLVAVITFLIATSDLIRAVIDMGDPLRSTYQLQLNLASFENFKVDAMANINTDAAYIPDDTALKNMFEAAKNELIANTNHRIRRSVIVNSLLIVFSLVLFILHWRWMYRLRKTNQD